MLPMLQEHKLCLVLMMWPLVKSVVLWKERACYVVETMMLGDCAAREWLSQYHTHASPGNVIVVISSEYN